jgi:hypothetical protein
MTPNLKNDKLQLGDIIWMHPILGRLTNKVLLTTSRGAIPFDRVSPRPDLVIELGEFDDKSVIIVVEERFRFEASREDGFQVP